MPTTPNMDLDVPTIHVTEDPQWSENFNENFDKIDAHDHTLGKGTPITPAALLIDEDVSLANFSLGDVKTVRYTPQASTPSDPADIVCTYFKTDGNLYAKNSSGVEVQITNGAGLNISVGVANIYTRVTSSTSLTILNTDGFNYVGLNSGSIPLNVFLPGVSSVTQGRFYWFNDIGGSANTNNITIVPAGLDTINGSATPYVINRGFGCVQFIGNGFGNWETITTATKQMVDGNTPTISGSVAAGLGAPTVSIAGSTAIVLTSPIITQSVVSTLNPSQTIGRIQPLTGLAGGSAALNQIPEDWCWDSSVASHAWINKTVASVITFPLGNLLDLSELTSLVVTVGGGMGDGGGFSVLPTGSDRASASFYATDGYGLTVSGSGLSVFDTSATPSDFTSAHNISLDLTSITLATRTINQSGTSVTIGQAPYQYFVRIKAPGNNYVANSFGVSRIQAFFKATKITPGG